ncbi:hypothetical protein NQ314_003775 [Rhamnusium bicolor]|uniref:Regulatory protein zeste n=1 Tax=Rhamnusium bicolor TaxID=1586634 RepID=A0AAV8ZN20_9CUCU|nr:hypothetical protein NQ314_003775 [Rhamnusium bicolor]
MDTKKRSTRTRPEHQRIIIDFVEKHPEMLTNSFRCAESRNKYNENWRILCITLNSVGYGEKSVEQWQRVLVDWLTKVKIKWINIKKDIKGTGGGPGSGSVLNDLEQRLLHLKGFSSVEGDGSTQEIGLRQLQLQTKPEEKTNGHKNYPGSTFATEALFEHDYENIMEISEYVSVDNNIEINSVSTETSTAQKKNC